MNILIVATQLPPYIGSGNIRALNYINQLSKLGHNVDVIGVDYPKDSIAYDANMEDSFSKDVNIFRIKSGYPYKYFYRKKSKLTNTNTNTNNKASINNSLKGKINQIIKSNFLIPDQFLFWIYPAYKQAMKMVTNKKYDILFTLHETPSSHIVGYLIKRKYPNIRWVGYWSDPWNGDSLRENRSIVKKSVEEKIEKKVIQKVDKLLFTTVKTSELYKKKYKLNSNKLSIVYRGYDKRAYRKYTGDKDNLRWLVKGKINIVHLGTIYNALRDVSPLVEALNNIQKLFPEYYKMLNILFIGQFDNVEDQRKLETHKVVSIVPLIPYEEAMKYTANADVLLLYGNKNSNQVPGKVYEYLGSNAVVLTIYSDTKDELINIMKEANKGPLTRNHPEEIFNTIIELVNRISTNSIIKAWKQPLEKFNWENVAKDLEAKLES